MAHVDAFTPPVAEQPILVLGAPRSGTSIFTYALRRGARINGYNEGHFLNILPAWLDISDRFYKRAAQHDGSSAVAVAHLPRAQIRRELVQLAFGIMDRLHAGSRWVDKTPGPFMIEVALAAYEAGLGVRVVFLHRRAIENVQSRLAKYPRWSVPAHAEAWVAVMARWREVRARLPADRWMEVDQIDIARRPENVVERVAPFLALTTDQAGGMAAKLREERKQQLASAEIGRTLAIEETGWSADDRTEFLKIAGDEMAAWGYGWSRDYRVSD